MIAGKGCCDLKQLTKIEKLGAQEPSSKRLRKELCDEPDIAGK